MSSGRSAPTARVPQELHSLFASAVAAKDVDGVLELYEPAAAVVVEPGRVTTGAAELRASVEQFLGRVASIGVETIDVASAADVALLRSSWAMHDVDGGVVTSRSIEVARRQPDGTWRYVIDNPWAG